MHIYIYVFYIYIYIYIYSYTYTHAGMNIQKSQLFGCSSMAQNQVQQRWLRLSRRIGDQEPVLGKKTSTDFHDNQ